MNQTQHEWDRLHGAQYDAEVGAQAWRALEPVKLELRAIKRMQGRDGEAFNATLYVDGVKAAYVHNDGNGGCNSYDWLSHDTRKRVEALATAQDLPFEFEKVDQLVDRLMYRDALRKQMQRWMKRSTPFRLVGAEDGEWQRLMTAPCEAAVANITRKYGDKVAVILTPDTLESILDAEVAAYEAEARSRLRIGRQLDGALGKQVAPSTGDAATC